jgi:hypothetical protein
MIQVILTKEQLDLIGDLRGIHVSLGAVLVLVKKGAMDKDEGLARMGQELLKAENVWKELTREGI